MSVLFFLLLTDLKAIIQNNMCTMYVGPVVYKNVICFTISLHRSKALLSKGNYSRWQRKPTGKSEANQ